MNETRHASTWSFLLTVLILSNSTLQALAYYHPDEGRWLSRDPIEERGGNGLYAASVNNLICHSDPLGQETYSQPNIVWANSPNTKKTITCGTLTLQHVYIDASLSDTLQNEYPNVYNDMVSAAQGSFTHALAYINTASFLGSGFVMSFEDNKKCCCEKFWWKQWVKGPHWWDVFYAWDYGKDASSPDVDFPGDVYSGLFSWNDFWQFKLRLYCLKKNGKEELVKEIKWSSRVQVNTKAAPVSATVTLDVNW